MGEQGNKQQGLVMQTTQKDQNPIVLFQTKFGQVKTEIQTWLSKQPIAIEAAAVSAFGAAQGAAIGAVMGTLNQDVSPTLPVPPNSLDPKAMATFQQAQALSGGPLIQARNFAVMTSVNLGIATVLRRVKGKEDVQSSMIAAFGSGAAFSLVSGMAGPNQIQNMLSSGIFFALAQGGIYKLGEKFSKPPVEDTSYLKTKDLLMNLGLEKYEKNFKRGLLNDQTLPLLTDSALKDVNIPPGPRLLILSHVKSDAEYSQKQRK
ncbi:chloroplastic import inner membrane translocase subunit HP30-2-like [Silene latifolia]|uniref:chloroplastic import inner membrane translocase subunit HP30-2-like n=1 Tax=Silene latifolia TaxID=37657 RepID=UPI003D77E9AC